MATKLVFALSKASDLYPDALSEGGLFALRAGCESGNREPWEEVDSGHI